jgi:hypothetical protein
VFLWTSETISARVFIYGMVTSFLLLTDRSTYDTLAKTWKGRGYNPETNSADIKIKPFLHDFYFFAPIEGCNFFLARPASGGQNGPSGLVSHPDSDLCLCKFTQNLIVNTMPWTSLA